MVNKFTNESPDFFNEVSIWTNKPNFSAILIYSIIVPAVCAFGIIGNILILVVLCRRTLKASTYTYLAVLAGADLFTCTLLLFSGLSRGIFWGKCGWTEFDAFVQLPVGSVSSNIAVFATVFVTLDRLVLVSGPISCKPPKFCNNHLAKKFMVLFSLIAVICNMPYCFIYKYDNEGNIIMRDFFHSRWYDVQNWFQLVIFGLLPSAFLLISNGVMLYSVGKTLRHRRHLFRRNKLRESKCIKDQARLTVTLIGIVFVFVVGELPEHLSSRTSAVSILYRGDPTKVDRQFIAKFRLYAAVLNAISNSANFVLYCLLSPNFLSQLKSILTIDTNTSRTT